jgi:hypothetical protein
MRFGGLVVAFSLCLAAASQTPMTVEKLAAFLRNAIESTDYKYTDHDISGFLVNVKMTERLDERTIEQLQGQLKIGPLTLVRLKMLADQSQSLVAAKPVVAPLPPKPIPPPSSEEQAAILDEVREYALTYSANLPDFIAPLAAARQTHHPAQLLPAEGRLQADPAEQHAHPGGLQETGRRHVVWRFRHHDAPGLRAPHGDPFRMGPLGHAAR